MMREDLLAIGFAETVRPLFMRWADDRPRALYPQIMADLWRGLPGDAGSTYLAAIEDLPEFEYDDSNHRDFYVMMGLGVVHLAIEVVQEAKAGKNLGHPWKELNDLFNELLAELDLDELPAELRRAATAIDSSRQDAATMMQQLAIKMAEQVTAALGPVAVGRGWPLERVRRPSGA